MKSSTIMTIVIILIVAIGGGLAYILSDNSSSTSQETESSQSTTITRPDNKDDSEQQPTNPEDSNYLDYSQQAFAAASDQTRLLFFHASWCPQCRALESDIEASVVPEDVAIFKVDFDNSQELRQKYDVTVQTTVVRVDDQGNLVDSYVPYDNPTLENVIANLL